MGMANQYWQNNPMVELRPLVGKEQMKTAAKIASQGTGAMDRDLDHMKEYDHISVSVSKPGNSVGRLT